MEGAWRIEEYNKKRRREKNGCIDGRQVRKMDWRTAPKCACIEEAGLSRIPAFVLSVVQISLLHVSKNLKPGLILGSKVKMVISFCNLGLTTRQKHSFNPCSAVDSASDF